MSAEWGNCSVCGRHDVMVEGMCVTDWCRKMDANEGATYRYFVKEGDGPEREVTKTEWVATERRAGFVNTLGHDAEPGTGGFGTSRHGGLSGRIDRVANA